MFDDGYNFQKRANIFVNELHNDSFPNGTTLARLAGCSVSTAKRVIDRLQDEFAVPIEYNNSRKGYYLRDKTFGLPSVLPPGKDELAALLLACDLLRSIDAKDLESKLQSLWYQYAANANFITRDLMNFQNYFSSDSTVVGDIADKGVLQFVELAAIGEILELRYKSPWRMGEERAFQGKILKVRFIDGSLYLLIHEKSGKHMVLNASFVKGIEKLKESIELQPVLPEYAKESWLKGFGVFAGEPTHEIVIHILPPAAEYYAAQRWHEDQEDSWEGDVLVRKMTGMISPEVVRRIMSLGRFVGKIEPKELHDAVREEVQLMANQLEA